MDRLSAVGIGHLGRWLELEANAERYTAARLMTDLLPFLEGQLAASAAAGIADKLDAMGAHASAAEARALI